MRQAIERAFSNLLSREPSAEDLQGLGLPSGGATDANEDHVLTIVLSQEALDLVDQVLRLFQVMRNRLPDAGEFGTAQALIRTRGIGLEAVAADLLASGTTGLGFEAHLESFYRNALGRGIGEGEAAAWRNTKLGLPAIAVAIANSGEFQKTCERSLRAIKSEIAWSTDPAYVLDGRSPLVVPSRVTDCRDIVQRNAAAPEQMVRQDGCFVDVFGVTTDVANLPGGTRFAGLVAGEADGVQLASGGIGEYAALLLAIENAASEDELTICELGAGWAPWLTTGGVIGRRRGVTRLNLIGLEADKNKFDLIPGHLALNGLSDGSCTLKLINGAAWYEDTTLQFPKSMSLLDYGARPSAAGKAEDYRGLEFEMETLQAYSLDSILEEVDAVDFMHIDIQGSEYDLVSRSRRVLENKARFVFIGTHSTRIEGDLLSLFHAWGWEVAHFKNCRFAYDGDKPSLEGMTVADGELLVSNPRKVRQRHRLVMDDGPDRKISIF